MSVLVLLETTAVPGKVEALKAHLAEILPDTRAFDGCEGVTVHQDQDAPDRLALVERWASRPHYEAYFSWRQGSGSLAQLGTLAAGPPSIRFLDDVSA